MLFSVVILIAWKGKKGIVIRTKAHMHTSIVVRLHGEGQELLEGVLGEGTHDNEGQEGDADAVEARQNLHRCVREAREAAEDPMTRGMKLVEPEALHAVPGTKVAKRRKTVENKPPKVEPAEARQQLEKAMSLETDVGMVYVTQQGQKLSCIVEPQRVALKGAQVLLVGLDRESNERRTYHVDRIERLRIKEA